VIFWDETRDGKDEHMSPAYETDPVDVRVVKILEGGEGPCGYKVGDSWTIEDLRAPAGLCTWAVNSMAPFLATLRFGGTFPWSEPGQEDVMQVTCPDAANPIVFELRRRRRGSD
jgi:uncharacterized repeat protein (TIGR04076 family)